MARITIKAINKALQAAGIQAEIIHGEGYFYFSGKDVDLAKEQGVYGVFRLSELSVEQWVEEAKSRAVPLEPREVRKPIMKLSFRSKGSE